MIMTNHGNICQLAEMSFIGKIICLTEVFFRSFSSKTGQQPNLQQHKLYNVPEEKREDTSTLECGNSLLITIL